MNIWIVVLIVTASACCSVFIYFRLRQQGAELAALKTLARDSGWTFRQTPATFGKGPTTTFANADEDWTITVAPVGGKGASLDQQIEWHTPAFALSDGAAVLGPPLGKTSKETSINPIHKIAARTFKSLMFQYVESHEHITQKMKLVAETSDDPRGVIMATPGQETVFDALRNNDALAKSFAHWHAKQQPVVIRDEAGLRLRVHRADHPTGTIKDIAAIGASISADLTN